MADEADVLMEGFRPGVIERLGIRPRRLPRGNPRLVYARITGWGQDGPYAHLAAHDINYLAAPALSTASARSDAPPCRRSTTSVITGGRDARGSWHHVGAGRSATGRAKGR